MYFAKDELIELNDERKLLILDTAFIDDIAYYKVEEIINDKNTEKIFYISAVNDEGKLYIEENLTEDETSKLDEILGN